jgi:hypothetical protein
MSQENPPGELTASVIDSEIFAAGGTFEMKDLDSPFSTDPWEFYYCVEDDANGTYEPALKQDARRICARNEALETFFICKAEVQLDDQNVGTGFGRRTNAGDNITEDQYKDCALVPEGSTMGYMYRVF